MQLYMWLKFGNIMFIMILKCHNNQNEKELFMINIEILPTQYCRKYHDYWKIHCSETFISLQLISDIVIILIFSDNYSDDIS